MEKLIDSDIVKEYLKRVIFGADVKIDGWVDAMPAADAEVVVRCAECRHCFDIGQDPMVPYDGEDVCHCEMWGREASAYQVDPYRFFCAKGERRDGAKVAEGGII